MSALEVTAVIAPSPVIVTEINHGLPGVDGRSAYEVAVAAGFVGTQQEWLDSLFGGPRGYSAYEVAVAAGFVGSEAAWLATLVGADSTVPGPQGPAGPQGLDGPQGTQGIAGSDATVTLGNISTALVPAEVVSVPAETDEVYLKGTVNGLLQKMSWAVLKAFFTPAAHTISHAPANADNTAANQTSHADVLVDGDVGVVVASQNHNHTGVYQPAGTYSTDIHENISALTAVSGVNTGDQDLSGYSQTSHNHTGVYAPVLGADDNYVTAAEKAALHAHGNKTALDNVSGVNTGDQDLSGYSPTSHNHNGTYEPANTNIQQHISSLHAPSNATADGATGDAHAGVTGNPHGTTAADVGAAAAGHNHTGTYAPVLGADDNYVTAAEKASLHAPGSDNQDLSNLVVKEAGKSLVADSEIAKIHADLTDASQAEAESGTEATNRRLSPLRVAQAIAAKLAAWKTIFGQVGAAPHYTLTDTIQTVALNYNSGNGATIDASAVTGSKAITLTMTNFPATTGTRGAYCLTIKTGATIPALVAPAGWVVGTLFSGIAANKTSEFFIRSVGTGTPRMKLYEAY